MLTSRAIKTLLNALRRVESELVMADTIFDIESLISDVTEEEADEIFKPANRRAPNFGVYQMIVNTQGIGVMKHVDVPKDHPDPIAAARDLRYNLNEAAKERRVWKSVELTEEEKSMVADNKKIDRFERFIPAANDEPERTIVVQRMKDGWKTEVHEPVILRWKVDSKDEEREVTEDGKTVKKTVKVPTRMHYHSVATEAIKKRAPRAKPTEETQAATDADHAAVNGTAAPEQVPAAV